MSGLTIVVAARRRLGCISNNAVAAAVPNTALRRESVMSDRMTASPMFNWIAENRVLLQCNRRLPNVVEKTGPEIPPCRMPNGGRFHYLSLIVSTLSDNFSRAGVFALLVERI
jgi:hypothetical protein